MDEVVTTDGKSVTVSAHLPYGEFRIGYLTTGGDGCGAPVDGVHTIRIHIVGQTAGATDT